jgi:hypothetical protein
MVMKVGSPKLHRRRRSDLLRRLLRAAYDAGFDDARRAFPDLSDDAVYDAWF